MKISKKITSILSITALSVMLFNCKDEVLIPVEDKTLADSVTTRILEEQGMKVTINTQLNALTISNQKLKDSIELLDENYHNISSTEREVQYTVNVLSFGTATLSNGRTTGISNATVTVEQNGTQQTQTTSHGLAAFKVKQGYVTVSVSSTDHGSVEYTAFVGYDESYDGKERNASSQVFLFPTSGASTATITAKVYKNSSTLDDTLNYHTYGAAAGSNLQGKYVTNPGIWASNSAGINNYTQMWEYYNRNSIYGTVNANNINWSMAAGYKLTVVPQIFDATDVSDIPNNIFASIDNGQITTMTYKGLMKSGISDANGVITISGIPASVEGLEVEFQSPEDGFINPHTRFTNGFASDEVGSTAADFKVYNPATATSSTVNKKYKTHNWYYQTYLYRNNWSPIVKSGQTYSEGIFLFPTHTSN